jgi:hypothetical protein
LRATGKTPEAYFRDVLSGVPELHGRLGAARRLNKIHVVSDFSYSAPRLYGRRFVVLGDAGFFLDPVFSSGVHLAILAGVTSADALHVCLTTRWLLNPLRRYERRLRTSQRLYRKFIYGWYTPGFVELFLSPSRRFKLLEAITSVLAGANRQWRMLPRLWLFFLLARLNRSGSLVPVADRAALPPV